MDPCLSPRALARSEIQIASSMIRTWVFNSICHGDNCHAKRTSDRANTNLFEVKAVYKIVWFDLFYLFNCILLYWVFQKREHFYWNSFKIL